MLIGRGQYTSWNTFWASLTNKSEPAEALPTFCLTTISKKHASSWNHEEHTRDVRTKHQVNKHQVDLDKKAVLEGESMYIEAVSRLSCTARQLLNRPGFLLTGTKLMLFTIPIARISNNNQLLTIGIIFNVPCLGSLKCYQSKSFRLGYRQ